MRSPHEPSQGDARGSTTKSIVGTPGGLLRASSGVEPVGPAAQASEDDEQHAAVWWRAMDSSTPSTIATVQADAAVGRAPLGRGAVVGRYVLLRELGKGGMGVVYAAYDPELDREVALKLVLPGKQGDEGRIRLLREAQVLAKLSHRNVVTIYDVGTTGAQGWLAMELVQGRTLRAWLNQPRAWREVLAVIGKVARGLAAAHAAGVLHRDVKPGNVMIGDDGRVRVMDFGLARACRGAAPPTEEESIRAPVVDALAMEVTQAGALWGTPPYMAPEQLMGRELTPAADQFSLCVMLWEGIHGKRPFAGRSLNELLDNVLAGRLQEPARGRVVPGWLRRVCERGLAADPLQRFLSMEALLDALERGQTRARVYKGLTVVGMLAMLWGGVEGSRSYARAKRTVACEASGAEVETAGTPSAGRRCATRWWPRG
jgi:predicted Ser/Thr protein kinase